MKSFTRYGVGMLAAMFLAVFVAVPLTHAQTTKNGQSTANGFKISPVRSEVTVNKGKRQTITISVENPTDIAVVAHPVINDFVASDDETGTPRLILDEKATPPKNSFRSLAGDLSDIPLDGRQKKDVQVTVSVPEDANAGGYYGAVRFVPLNDTQQGNLGLTASVGTIVLVTVPGNLQEQAELVQLSAAQTKNNKTTTKSFLTSGDVQMVVRIKNSGDIHVKPFGRVTVKNMFGKEVTSYELNNTEPRANLLPGSTRKFVDNLNYKKWFGRYTVSVNLGYSQGGGKLITAKSTFWYMPAWSIYALIALLAAVIIGVYVLYRRLTSNSRHHK